MPELAGIFAEFPVQAALLRRCHHAGFSEGAIKIAIETSASLAPGLKRQWNDFFRKVAAGPIPGGVPGGIQSKPPSALPKPPASPPGGPRVPGPIPLPNQPVGQARILQIQQRSSQQTQAAREGDALNQSWFHQLLGATPENVGLGQQAEITQADRIRSQMQAAGKSPSLPVNQAAFNHAVTAYNPTSPRHDGPVPVLAAVGGQLPRAAAGVAAFPAAAATDVARAVTGNGADFRHMTGAAIDAGSPLTKGLGVNPYGNAGYRSLFGTTLPGYAKQLGEYASTTDNPLGRWAANTAQPIVDHAELLANLKGITGAEGSGLVTDAVRRGGQLGLGLFGAQQVAYGGLGNAAEEWTGEAANSANTQRSMDTMNRVQRAISPEVPVAAGRGDNLAMNPASVATNRANAAEDARTQQALASGDPAAVAALVGSNAAADAPVAPAPVPAGPAPKPAAPPSPVVAAAAHPEAQAQAARQAPQAWAGVQDLSQRITNGVTTPEQGAAEMARHMDAFADPALKAEVAGMIQGGKFQPAQAQQIAGRIAPQAKAFGIEDVGKFIEQNPMQAAALAIGIPMAVLGIGQGLFGQGGLGSLLMALLGIGGAAYGSGLTSGRGPLGQYAGMLGRGRDRVDDPVPPPRSAHLP